MIALEPSDFADVFMRIWNADGGEVGACGNAARCVAALARRRARHRLTSASRPRAGCWRRRSNQDGSVTIDMGTPRFDWNEIPLSQPFRRHAGGRAAAVRPTWVSARRRWSMSATRTASSLSKISRRMTLPASGPMLEHHPLFPERANISLAPGDRACLLAAPHLGARRRAHTRLRHRGLRRRRRRGAPRAHWPACDE